MKSIRIHRRRFLGAASAAAAGLSLPSLIPSQVLGGPDRPGANGIVNVAVIGCGGRAVITNTCKVISTIRIAAVCDCEFLRAERFAKDLSGDAKWRDRGLPRNDRKGETQRRDDRDDDPRPGMDRHPGDAGGAQRVH